MIGNVKAETYIDGCGRLDIPSETYILTTDIYSEESCFQIWQIT